jgi:hypothetical protein
VVGTLNKTLSSQCALKDMIAISFLCFCLKPVMYKNIQVKLLIYAKL